jgi:hypothetical protein
MKFIDNVNVAIDSNDEISYSDYKVIGADLKKINPNKNSRFLINTLIDIGYYQQIKKLDHVYPFMYSYAMTAVLSNSSVMFKARIKFSEGNFYLYLNLSYLNSQEK